MTGSISFEEKGSNGMKSGLKKRQPANNKSQNPEGFHDSYGNPKKSEASLLKIHS